MQGTLSEFFRTVTSQLARICEGRYEATDEVLKFSDPSKNGPKVVGLAETVGLMSVKLEAREMALERTIGELKATIADRGQFAIFFIIFTIFMSIYTFVSAYMYQSGLSGAQVDVLSPIIGLAFLFLLIIMSIVYIRLSPFTVGMFGLTFKGSSRAIAESLIATLPVLILISLLRWWCIHHLDQYRGLPFFEMESFDYGFWMYLFVAPSQEFLIRGVAQTVLFRLLGGGHAKFWAIVLASLLFAVSHTYFSFWISVLSILGGFFWGFLYMRHQTIVGVAVSHFLIGDYMLATGIWKMLI